ncbi:MAG TPA: nuclear transport factor 2 family protein [Steroidobacteraceae bacterium]|jgi:ketosteroid isomerase-like protein|nr:nuclear transport factor 2 family protein [Steroidobacteraceae bacterium]
MTVNAKSRRALLAAGAYTWFGTAVLFQEAQGTNATSRIQDSSIMPREKLIRTYYEGWVKEDWSTVDGFLADSFTFSSAAPDDHISKSTFKRQCWDTQAGSIGRFELESMLANANGTEAFVKYLCHTKKGTSFRNVEYFRFADSKIHAIECYFGGNLGYPTASDSGKK